MGEFASTRQPRPAFIHDGGDWECSLVLFQAAAPTSIKIQDQMASCSSDFRTITYASTMAHTSVETTIQRSIGGTRMCQLTMAMPSALNSSRGLDPDAERRQSR